MSSVSSSLSGGRSQSIKTNNSNNSTNGRKQQLPSFILFASVILFVNLCPSFNQDFQQDELTTALSGVKRLHSISESCLRFVGLMFTNPVRLGKRAARFTQADAAMLGKMAKVWYIKKKIKKLGKKLKKHTIAVPVFTAIPIYEHSYYPQQAHVAQQHHLGASHHAAASSYSPTFVSAASGSGAHPLHLTTAGQLATSASSTHQQVAPVAFRTQQQQAHAMFHAQSHPHPHPHAGVGAHNQIINSYAPSPPLYVDEVGGLYGHYGNAYGRYDGGYQLW